jgi:TRAP-type C4-dicarboxylate transport system permease small subunit
MLKYRVSEVARAIERWTKRASYVLAILSAVSILLMMLAVSADVIGRYVFDSPILGALEFALLLMVIVVFLGVGYTQTIEQHIAVDVIYMRLPRRLRLPVDIFNLLVVLSISIILAWRTVSHASYSISIGEYIPGMANFPKYPSKIALATGAVML